MVITMDIEQQANYYAVIPAPVRYNKKLKYLHFLSIFFRHGDLKTARKTRRFSVLSKNRTIPHSKSNLPIRKAKPRLKTSLKTKKFIQ